MPACTPARALLLPVAVSVLQNVLIFSLQLVCVTVHRDLLRLNCSRCSPAPRLTTAQRNIMAARHDTSKDTNDLVGSAHGGDQNFNSSAPGTMSGSGPTSGTGMTGTEGTNPPTPGVRTGAGLTTGGTVPGAGASTGVGPAIGGGATAGSVTGGGMASGGATGGGSADRASANPATDTDVHPQVGGLLLARVRVVSRPTQIPACMLSHATSHAPRGCD